MSFTSIMTRLIRQGWSIRRRRCFHPTGYSCINTSDRMRAAPSENRHSFSCKYTEHGQINEDRG